MNLLEINHLNVSYKEKQVLQDICLTVKEGEVLAILGESGCGKSTLLKAILGLLGGEGSIDSGEILFRGRNLEALSQKELRQICGKKIGMIFQNTESSLCPVRRIETQFYDMMKAHGYKDKSFVKEKALELCALMGMKDGARVLKSYPHELSGGMNQRVGILMAMMLEPELILADEPTSALDVYVQRQVMEELMKLRELHHTAMILVTHNLGVANAMADRVVKMKDGNCEGTE